MPLNPKRIVQIDKEGNDLIVFDTAAELVKETGIRNKSTSTVPSNTTLSVAKETSHSTL